MVGTVTDLEFDFGMLGRDNGKAKGSAVVIKIPHERSTAARLD